MSIDYVALAAELTAGHPDTGAYSANNATAADELNAINRPADGDVGEMMTYCVINRSRTNNGADTIPLPLLGRLHLVAEAALGADPFGTTVAANQVTREMKSWAESFLDILRSPSDKLSTLDFLDTEIDAGYTALGPGEAVVWKTPDITALKGFSQNKQSRASELGFRRIKERDVERAREV